MPRLTARDRHALPKKDFAGPGESYPIPDEEHGRKAVQLAPRGVKAGNISPSEASAIKAKVHAKFPSIGQRILRGAKSKGK